MKRVVRLALVLLIALVMSVCAYAASYEVYVGSVQVTDENAADVLGDADEGASVTYDAVSKVLTLNNAQIDGFYTTGGRNCGIYSGGDLNIVLVGDNSIAVFPNEDEIEEFAIAVMALGNVTVYSEDVATLDIDVGATTRENFGFYVVNGTFTLSGKAALDITLSDFIITDVPEDVNATFGNSIGIHSNYGAHFLDECSVKCITGDVFVPENSGFVGSLDNINSGGTSVGIAVYGDLVLDTTGEMCFNVGDADGKRAGVACFGTLEMKQGSVVVEMAQSKNEYLVAGAIVYGAQGVGYPCIPLCGTNADDLETGSFEDVQMGGFDIKSSVASDGSLASYTMLVASVVGLPETETDSEGKTTVSVTVEDEEKVSNALIIFSAYNGGGKMRAIKFSYGAQAVDGKISAELDVSDAVTVKVFVFENDGSFVPLSPALTATVLSQTE